MKIPAILTALGSLLICGFARGAVADWKASSGLYPDQITPPFTLFNISAGAPALSGGVLEIATNLNGGDYSLYDLSGASLNNVSSLTIQAEMKFVLGGSYVAGNPRASAGIYFAPVAGVYNQLWIDKDFIFLNGAELNEVGPSAVVDTDGAFHTYRIVVRGVAEGSIVDVYYDSNLTPVLTGNLFEFGNSQPTVGWGDISGATGTGSVSQWKSFVIVPEPSTVGLIAVAALPLLSYRRFSSAVLRREPRSRR